MSKEIEHLKIMIKDAKQRVPVNGVKIPHNVGLKKMKRMITEKKKEERNAEIHGRNS